MQGKAEARGILSRRPLFLLIFVLGRLRIARRGVIMGVVIFITEKLQASVIAIVIIGIIAATVYFMAIIALNVFSDEELKSLPLSKFLIAINNKMNGNNTNGDHK